MNDEDTKALEAALESIKRLEAKNSELIAREKAAKAAADTARDEAEAKSAEAALNSGEVDKVRKALEDKHAKELAGLNAQLAERDKSLKTLTVNGAIAAELAKANVHSHFAPVLQTSLEARAIYENGEATIDGKSVSEYVTGFFKSKDGLHFVRPADNAGTGAQGGEGSKSMQFDKNNMDYTAFAKLAKEDPAAANAMADSLGMPELRV